jgi:hypothetical protein
VHRLRLLMLSEGEQVLGVIEVAGTVARYYFA